MTATYLTDRATCAHNPVMGRKRWLGGAMGVLSLGLVGGCVNVTAPNEPIVIELNINIKQDVVYSLAPDAGNTIDANEDIF